jgi:ferrous iron transport protein B
MGVCLITGIAAKEIVVSTMGVIYPDNPKNPSTSLEQRITASGEYTMPATLSFLVFTLLYFPCLATLTAIYNETGSVKWPLFSLTMTTALAWIAAFLTFNIAVLFV